VTKTLVTGGAGFIGSHLTRKLLKDRHHVRVLDNFSTGRKENLSGLNGDLDIQQGDIRDIQAVREAVKNVDVIFHEAAFVSSPQSLLEPTTCLEVNVHGTELLLEEARKAGVRRIILASSAAVYGDTDQFPTTELSPVQPLSPYAASKAIGEIYAGMYTAAYGMEVVALRYFNVFGPMQSPESEYAAAIPIFIRQILDNKPITIFGDGNQTRDLIYVEDIVNANLLAAESNQAPGKVFNICSGEETSILNLIHSLQEIGNTSLDPIFEPARQGDIYRSSGDPQLAKDILGFNPLTSLPQGLSLSMNWMLKCQ
jgi:nucleoside-diphosphate-sugar epimerase